MVAETQANCRNRLTERRMPRVPHSMRALAAEFRRSRATVLHVAREWGVPLFRGPRGAICVDAAGYRRLKRLLSQTLTPLNEDR